MFKSAFARLAIVLSAFAGAVALVLLSPTLPLSSHLRSRAQSLGAARSTAEKRTLKVLDVATWASLSFLLVLPTAFKRAAPATAPTAAFDGASSIAAEDEAAMRLA